MTGELLYFAYGANLNRDDLAKWCQERRLDYPLGEKVANAYLPDTRLIANYYSSFRQGGILNIKYQLGQATPGALFRVLPGGWNVLDIKGDRKNMYKHLNIVALTDDGREHVAVAYQVDAAKTSRTFVPLNPDYRRIVREGMEAHGIDAGVFNAVAEGRDPDYPIRHIFVYGTLMSEGPRHYLLAAWADIESRRPARVNGLLYNSWKGFPCMIPDVTERSQVMGELYTLTDPKKAFEILDIVETAKRYAATGAFFRRAIVAATRQDGTKCPAWTYFVDMSVEGMPRIDSGDWRSVIA
ncbi:MAG: gamma-glutamylcyclotransferase [Pseudomonadota bacterium]|nr:gamma-glutamylcyclotransferase [Pseudomonadota bacterium]